MASGYGDGRVMIGQYLVGRVAIADLTAVPALSPRIRFGLAWTLGHLTRSGDLPEEYQLIDFGGELRLGTDDLFVGRSATISCTRTFTDQASRNSVSRGTPWTEVTSTAQSCRRERPSALWRSP